MRLSSFRTRVALLSVLFGIVFVGAVAVIIYLVVAQGMANVALENNARLATVASDSIKQATALATLRASRDTKLTHAQQRAEASRQVERQLFDLLDRRDVSEAEFAVYAGGRELRWYTSQQALLSDGIDEAHRLESLDRMQPMQVKPAKSRLLSGLLTKADLGRYAIHVPVVLPNSERWVVDVIYYPRREQSTIDAIRPPMMWVGTGAILVAMLLMQASMGWVLRLVQQLQQAADSIDAGRLDHRLPESGNNEIGDLARSLNNLIDRLRHRADVQTRFVADASHELATPVAGIRGYVNILRAWGGEDAEVRDEALAAIDRESRRMARLCGDLLSAIRSDEAPEYRRVRYDLNAISREVLANAATRYLEKGLEFVGPEDERLFVVGDADRIEEALGILVDNACKYTLPGGTVRVSTWRKRESVVIEVADTGAGISERDLENIFERFYRSDHSRSAETGGFGLGLAIAKHIVDASGGTIDVASRIGEGTTFTIRLPRKQR